MICIASESILVEHFFRNILELWNSLLFSLLGNIYLLVRSYFVFFSHLAVRCLAKRPKTTYNWIGFFRIWNNSLSLHSVGLRAQIVRTIVCFLVYLCFNSIRFLFRDIISLQVFIYFNPRYLLFFFSQSILSFEGMGFYYGKCLTFLFMWLLHMFLVFTQPY